jgi:hypothetical protein
VAIAGLDGRDLVQLAPQRQVPLADALRRGYRLLDIIVPVLEGSQVGQPEGDVLDEDLEVERALPVRQLRVNLARLGIDQERLNPVAIAPEQRVRQRAVAPEDPSPVEIHEEPRHRIEKARAVWPGPDREAHHQSPVLERVLQVFGDQDG